jgi:protein-tyrosine phosphatase
MKITLINPSNNAFVEQQKPYHIEYISKQRELGNISRNKVVQLGTDREAIEWMKLIASGDDRSVPEDIYFEWECNGCSAGVIDYEVVISKNADFTDIDRIKRTSGLVEAGNMRVSNDNPYITKNNKTYNGNLTENTDNEILTDDDKIFFSNEKPNLSSNENLSATAGMVFNNFQLGMEYFWKVVASKDGEEVASSDTFHFTVSSNPPRWLKVPNITNVRDMGGWETTDGRKVIQGLIIRSAAFNTSANLTDEGKSVLLDELKIKTDLDMRSMEEEIGPILDEEKVNYINIPIAPYNNISESIFVEPYRKCFEIFADKNNYPIIFHCYGGADRAGTVAFLLNAMLGVDFYDLCLDYELTSFSIWGERTRTYEDFANMIVYLNSLGDESDSFMSKSEKFLLYIGVTQSQIDTIRENLIV